MSENLEIVKFLEIEPMIQPRIPEKEYKSSKNFLKKNLTPHKVGHSFTEILENAVLFVTGNVRKFKWEFYIEWKLLPSQTGSFFVNSQLFFTSRS